MVINFRIQKINNIDMAKQKFQKGEKVKIDCLTEQLRLISILDFQPGQTVWIVKKDFRDKDRDFYQVTDNPDETRTTYIIPENYLTKIK